MTCTRREKPCQTYKDLQDIIAILGIDEPERRPEISAGPRPKDSRSCRSRPRAEQFHRSRAAM